MVFAGTNEVQFHESFDSQFANRVRVGSSSPYSRLGLRVNARPTEKICSVSQRDTLLHVRLSELILEL